MSCKDLIKCTYTNRVCSSWAKCKECVSHHVKRNEIPACFFPPEVEKLHDMVTKAICADL